MKQSNSLTVLELLLVLFIGLKLSHVIHWSWWWVFSPFWIPLLIILSIAGIWFFGYALVRVCRR